MVGPLRRLAVFPPVAGSLAARAQFRAPNLLANFDSVEILRGGGEIPLAEPRRIRPRADGHLLSQRDPVGHGAGRRDSPPELQVPPQARIDS